MPLLSQKSIVAGVSLIIASLACTPIVTIGWSELIIILIMSLLILLPLAFRIVRALRGKDNHRP